MKKMTHILFVLMIGATVLADSTVAAGRKRTVLKPRSASQEIAIVVAGKTRSYYPLSSSHPSIIEVRGPGELRVLTRALLDATTKEVGYTVLYAIDGDGPQTFDVEGVERAPNAIYKETGMGVPGEAEAFTLTIGHGNHTITLSLRDSLPKVSARYLFLPHKQRKTKWVAMSPLAPIEPVDLYAGERTIHCYRFSSDKPLRISIIGPTVLRILTRLENSFTMKGRINYRIQIRQSGQVVQTFQLSSRRSETTLYRDSPNLVPGKVREIVFTVPKGMQHYEIVPLDKHTVLAQVLFPQKDAKREL